MQVMVVVVVLLLLCWCRTQVVTKRALAMTC
jgi:hypothetical protein